MILRPFTGLCLIAAAGSGLYLYQVKHHAQVLERGIARTMKQADTVRQRTGLMRAEYALLNDPSRLAELAEQLMPALRTTAPTQFAALGDLERRLPAIGAAPAAEPLEPQAPDAVVPKAAKPTLARPEAPAPEGAKPEPARTEPSRTDQPAPPAIASRAPRRPPCPRRSRSRSCPPPWRRPRPAQRWSRPLPPPRPAPPAVPARGHRHAAAAAIRAARRRAIGANRAGRSAAAGRAACRPAAAARWPRPRRPPRPSPCASHRPPRPGPPTRRPPSAPASA